MIRDLIDLAKDQWPTWFFGESPEDLSASILGGGPAHRNRFILFLHRRKAKPRVLMKVANTPVEAHRLRNEYAAMTGVRQLLGVQLQQTIPESLGIYESNGSTVLATRIISGSRLFVPTLSGSGSPPARMVMRRFFRQSFEWSSEVANATRKLHAKGSDEPAELVEKFISLLPQDMGSQNLRSFQQAVSRARLESFAAWQHRDVTVGNVLRHRRGLSFVDWEYASAESEPWYDIAYAPGATCHLAGALIQRPSMQEAALNVLPKKTWVGAILSDEMHRAWAFDVPIGWAVTLNAMSVAVRRYEEEPHGENPWTGFAIALLDDKELRSQASWIVPS